MNPLAPVTRVVSANQFQILTDPGEDLQGAIDLLIGVGRHVACAQEA